MAGMPELQEHFPATARDGGYAGIAGAFSGYKCLRQDRIAGATFPQ
jgi:hypothetical protein